MPNFRLQNQYMNFVQNSFLIAAAAVAIPLIVHLLSRRQVRTVELGTMRFLQEVVEDGSQRRRLRRWLLLAVRTLVMLLLALLFARPYLTELVTGRVGDRTRIILIDRSSSMAILGNEGRLIDEAVAAASEAGQEAGGASLVYAWFDRHVEPVSAETDAPDPPRTMVGSTDYGAAIRWTRNFVDSRPGAAIDVVLISDLQQNGLRSRAAETAVDTLPADVPVRLVDVGREAVNNLAIVNVQMESTRVASGQPVRLAMTLFNYGSLPYEGITARVVALQNEQSVRVRKTANINAGEATELEIDLGKLAPGMWQITVAVDVDDEHVLDNQRMAAVEVAVPADVLVIDSHQPDVKELATSYHLFTALAQGEPDMTSGSQGKAADTHPDAARFKPDVIYLDTDGVPTLSPQTTPLIAVADPAVVSGRLLDRLSKYAQEGGNLLVFGGDLSAEAIDQWQRSGLTPGTMKPPVRSGAMPFRIVSVETDSVMMAPFGDPQHADLSRLSFRRLLPVEPHGNSEVLAWFDEGRPAVTRQKTGQGTLVWFLSSADSDWSSWTSSPLYLPLVQQMAADLLHLTGEGRIRHRRVGDEDGDLLLTHIEQPEWRPASTKDPDGRTAISRKSLTFNSPGFATRGDVLYVVNGDARESDPARIAPTAFASHFGLNIDGERAAADETRPVNIDRRVEYWPWLAAAVFVLVFAEFCLANRTTA